MAVTYARHCSAGRARTFFVHIMKTGGTTFWWHVYANLGEGAIYPNKELDPGDAYFSVERLRSLPTERHEQIRGYTGHFPWMATELVPGPLVTLTILRDPVERTLSYLRQASSTPGPTKGWPLERIYDDPGQFTSVIHDHQTKIFSMTHSDGCETYLSAVAIDGDRLAAARDNLDKVDVVGLSEAFPDFLDAVARRLGWEVGPVTNRRVSTTRPAVPASLRRRIAEDNAFDMALYDHARSIAAKQLVG